MHKWKSIARKMKRIEAGGAAAVADFLVALG